MELDYSKFKFLRDIEKPILALAVDMEKAYKDLKFKKEFRFEPISHQCAGVACHHYNFYIKQLKFKNNKLLEGAVKLHKIYYNSNLGCMGNRLDDLIEYRRNLKYLLGVDCNNSWPYLQEGIYPVDIDWLKKLTNEKLPFNLGDMTTLKHPLHRIMDCYNIFQLVILAENSD